MKYNKGHWTIDKQNQMCHAITTIIFKNAKKFKTDLTTQIIKQADRFPVGLKQYYADKLLLYCVVIEIMKKESYK